MRNLSEENEELREILLEILSKWEREKLGVPEGRIAASGNEESGSPEPVALPSPPNREEPVFTTTTVIVGPDPGGPADPRVGTPPSPPFPPPHVPGDAPLQDTLVIDTLKGPGLRPESGAPGGGAGISPGTGEEADELEKTVIIRAEGSPFPAGEQGGQKPVPGEGEPGKEKGETGIAGSPGPGEDLLDKTMVLRDLRDRKVPPNKKP